MYFCTVNGYSRAMICTLSSAHWLQASKLSALLRLETIWKDWDKCAYQYNNNNSSKKILQKLVKFVNVVRNEKCLKKMVYVCVLNETVNVWLNLDSCKHPLFCCDIATFFFSAWFCRFLLLSFLFVTPIGFEKINWLDLTWLDSWLD